MLKGAAGPPLAGDIIAAFENEIGHTTFSYDANDDMFFYTAPESQGTKRADAASPGVSLTHLGRQRRWWSGNVIVYSKPNLANRLT